MRYYDLQILDAAGNEKARWTSYPNGKPDSNALDIEFDAIVADQGAPVGNAFATVQVYGIPLNLLREAQVYTGLHLVLRGGMGGGFPLENPAQQGTLLGGKIFQSFGNWVGTDMVLSFVVSAGYFGPSQPGSFVLDWPKGSALGAAVKQSLSAAFHGTQMQVETNLSDSWTNDYDVKHVCDTLPELSEMLADNTRSGLGGPVRVACNANKITLYDGSYKGRNIQLSFTDLIGQPTWVAVTQMQLMTVLRGDIQLSDNITMPIGMLAGPGSVSVTPESQPSQIRYKSTFQNTYKVVSIRHVGHFQGRDSSEWATIINAVNTSN